MNLSSHLFHIASPGRRIFVFECAKRVSLKRCRLVVTALAPWCDPQNLVEFLLSLQLHSVRSVFLCYSMTGLGVSGENNA